MIVLVILLSQQLELFKNVRSQLVLSIDVILKLTHDNESTPVQVFEVFVDLVDFCIVVFVQLDLFSSYSILYLIVIRLIAQLRLRIRS